MPKSRSHQSKPKRKAKATPKRRAHPATPASPQPAHSTSNHSALSFKTSFLASFTRARAHAWQNKRTKLRLHRSFKFSYREDYQRQTHLISPLHHVARTFRLICSNWRLFLPLILLTMLISTLLAGLLSEDAYVQFQRLIDNRADNVVSEKISGITKASLLLISAITTGGVTNTPTESQGLLLSFIYFLLWLVTIYIIRHRLAAQPIKLRDALYNAPAAFISSLCILCTLLLHAVPLFIVIFTYSVAVSTDFLADPFYALVYFVFAAPLALLALFLLSGTLLALVAVSAPGLYPAAALSGAANLISGRRLLFLNRIFSLVAALAVSWVVILLPVIALDLQLKSQLPWLAGVPIVPLLTMFMTIFSIIYTATYLYLFYRQLLDYKEDYDRKS